MSAPLVAVGGLSGGALAAVLGIPVLGYLAWKYLLNKSTPDEAAVAEAAAAYTHPGPRGERVFNRDAAQGILRALPGMSYSHPQPGNHHLVEIHPERGGAPPAPPLSAANWMRTQNRRMSVLAPVYLPMPTSAARFLRLAPPGHEGDLAPFGYAVLAYAQAHHRPAPGQPVTGLPPSVPQRTSPIPTPVSQAYQELPPALHNELTKILRNPVKPNEGAALANEFARAGLDATASVIQTKASNAASQAALGMPPASYASTESILPSGWIAPVALVQSFLNTMRATAKPLVVDGKLGPLTLTAVKAFQRFHGLSESGVVDGPTLTALNAAVLPHAQAAAAPDAAHSTYVAPEKSKWWPSTTSGHDYYDDRSTASASNAIQQQLLNPATRQQGQLALAQMQKAANAGNPAASASIQWLHNAASSLKQNGNPAGHVLAHHLGRVGMGFNRGQQGGFGGGRPGLGPGGFAYHPGFGRDRDRYRHDDRGGRPAPPMTGANVIALATPSQPVQRALILLSLPPTFAGLKSFQQGYGLPATGLLDAGTWTALQQAVLQTTGQSASGSDSDALTVQQYLVRLNLLPFFAMTGKFDELTRKAIRSFQSAKKLPANGILDPRTAALLIQAAQNLPDPMASSSGAYQRAAYARNRTGAVFSPYPTIPRQNISLEPLMGPPWS